MCFYHPLIYYCFAVAFKNASHRAAMERTYMQNSSNKEGNKQRGNQNTEEGSRRVAGDDVFLRLRRYSLSKVATKVTLWQLSTVIC